jgi:hypothetical protein
MTVYLIRHQAWFARTINYLRYLGSVVAGWAPFVQLVVFIGAVTTLALVFLVAGRTLEMQRLGATRFVGVFPANMPAINDLITNTKDELVVACDFTNYGSFSYPRAYEEYQGHLHDLLGDGKKVQILCYDKDTEEKARADQFAYSPNDKGTTQAFLAFTQTPRWVAYFKRYPAKTKPGDWQGFSKMMSESNADCKKEIRSRNGNIEEIDKKLPVFVWIRDGEEAIFSFYTSGSGSREMSFRTRDAQFIQVLRDLINSYRPLGGTGS